MADGPRASRHAPRRTPGGFGGQLALWRDDEPEAAVDARDRGVEERAGGRAPDRGTGRETERAARALSREEIARSDDLRRRYAVEYGCMLHVIGDREIAREAARVNVSALCMGQARIVPLEGRFSVEELRDVLARGAKNLDQIRRAVSRLLTPDLRPLRTLRSRQQGPER